MYRLISNIQKVIKINDCHFIYAIYSGIVVPKGYLREKKYSRTVWVLYCCSSFICANKTPPLDLLKRATMQL